MQIIKKRTQKKNTDKHNRWFALQSIDILTFWKDSVAIHSSKKAKRGELKAGLIKNQPA